LTHTSGLDQQANTVERATPGMTAADHLQQALEAGLSFAPGERVEYCSPTFWVLAELITRLSGESYVEHFDRHIAAACGMRATGYDVSATSDAVPAYGVADPTLPDEQRRLAYPAGAIVSTAEDLVLFGQALLNAGRAQTDQRLLAPATVRAAVESRTDHLPGNPFGTTRSLGFVVGGPGTLRSPTTFGHGGASGTYFWVDPRAEVVVVFLSADWSLDRRLLAAVIDTVVGQLSLGD
jgi:CubicO group peptidase (beta-lactamase class C family)